MTLWAHVLRPLLAATCNAGCRLLAPDHRKQPHQCVRILSAVVPANLSFELNQCLRNGVMSLQKGHALACTEPFRVALAGKVRTAVCLLLLVAGTETAGNTPKI